MSDFNDGVPKYILNGNLVSKEDADLLVNSPSFISDLKAGKYTFDVENDEDMLSSMQMNINDSNFSENFYKVSDSDINYGVNEKSNLRDSDVSFDMTQLAFQNSMNSGIIDDSEFQTGVNSVEDLDDATLKDKFFSYLQNPNGTPTDKVLRKAALKENTMYDPINNFLMETAVKIADGGKHEVLIHGGIDENGQPILKAIPYDKSVKKNVNTLSKYGIKDTDQNFIGVVAQNFVNTLSDTDDMAIFLADAVGDMTYDYIFDAHSPTTLDKIANEVYKNKTKIERIDNPESSEQLFTSDWWASGIGSGAASILQFAAIGGGAGTVFRAMGMGAKTAAGLAKYSAGMLLNTAEGYEQAKAAGLSDKETSALGLITGLVKTAIEATVFPGLENRLVGYEATKGIQDVILKETGGKLTKEAIKKAEKNILNKSLDFAKVYVKSGKASNNFAAEGVKEFMEEFSQTYVDVIGQVAYDYMNADDPKFYTSFNSHSFKEALGAGAIGFLMGAGASVLPTKTRDISGQNLSETIYTEGARSVNAGIKVLELKGEISPEKADNLRQKVAKVDGIIKANRNLFKKIRKETGGLSALITNQTINNINKAELLKQEIDTLREKPIERIDGETDANYNERVRERDEVISAKEDTLNQLNKTFELFEGNQKPFESAKDKGVSELAGAVLSTINLADVVDSNMPLETKTILVNNDFNNKSNAILLANGTLKPSDNLKQAFEFIDNNDKTLETKDKVFKDFDLNFVERLAVGQYMFAKDLGKNLLNLVKSKEELIKKLKVQDKEKKSEVKKKAEKIVDKDTKENIEEESESEGTIDELVDAINEKTNEESTVVSEEANNAEEGDNTLTGADLIDVEEGEEADVSEEQKLESENTETEVKSETLRKIYTDKFLALSKNILNSKYLSNIFTEEQIESVKNIDDLLELVFQVGNPLEILNNLLALSKGINTETEDIVDEEIESTEQFEQVPSLDNILTLQYPTSAEKNEDGKRKFAPIPFDLTVLYNGNFKKVEVVLERNEEEDKRINHNTWYDPIKNGVIEAVVYDKDGNRYIIGYLMASDNVYNKDSKNLQSLREHIAKGNNVKVTINKIIDQKLKTSTSSKHGKNSPHQVNTHGSGILYGIANRSSSGATYIDVPNKKDIIVLDAAGKAGNNYMLIPTMDGTAYFAAHLRMLKLSETPEFLQEVKEIIASYDGTNYEDIKDKLESMLVVNLSNNYGKPKIKVGKEWYDLDKAPIENLNHRLDKAKANTGSYNLELSKRGGVKTGLQQKQNLTGKVVLDPIFPETTVDTVVSKKEESVKLPISIPGLSTQGVKLNTPFEKILRELGWSDESISKMSFETQQQLVENKTKAPTVETSSKIDINKENKKQEKLAELNAELDKELLEAQKDAIEKRRQEAKNNPVSEPEEYAKAVDEYKQTELGGGENAKTKKENLVKQAQTKEGKAFVENQVAQLEYNEDGTITVYRSGTMQEGHNPATTNKKTAELIASERKKQGLSSDIIEVRVNPSDISAVVPGMESEVLIKVDNENKERIEKSTKKEQKTKLQLESERDSVKAELEKLKSKHAATKKSKSDGTFSFSDNVYNDIVKKQELKIKNLEWQLKKYDAELAALEDTTLTIEQQKADIERKLGVKLPAKNTAIPVSPKTWGDRKSLANQISSELKGVVERGVSMQEWLDKGYGRQLATWSDETIVEFLEVADIERRRQEELNNYYWDSDGVKSEKTDELVLGSKTNKTGYKLNDINLEGIFGQIITGEDLLNKYLYPAINAKYDAELDALESTIKEGVSELFESNPELAKIGTPEQYSQYLDTIFPDSKVKDIVYRGDNTTDYNKEKTGVFGKGIYFSQSKVLAKFHSDKIKGQVNSAILNTINPNTEYYFHPDFKEKAGYKSVYKGIKLDKNEDAVVGLRADSLGEIKEYVVFEPEQIHILGSKQDVKGFKDFIKKEEPTKDTDNNDDILDDDDLGVAFSRVTDDNKSQWNKEKELAYIKEKLGDDQEVVVNTEKLLEIVKEAGGQDAWGLVKNSIIYLRDNAVKGTGYHEAFHVVFRYYLSDLEQAKLLGDRTEEQMAVLFEQYKVEREDMTLPAKVKEFFKNLYYTIYELFKPNNIKSLNHLFSQIDRGVFKDKTKRDVSRFKKEDVAYSIIKVGGLNPLQIKQRVSTLNNKAFKIYENTVRKNPELNGMSFPEFVNIVSSERGMEDLYRKAYKEIKDDFLSETDPEKKKQFKLFLSNIFRKENDQLVKGKLYELAIRDLQNYGINAKIEGLADKTQLLDEAISEGEVEELEQEQIGGWTVSNLSVDPRKTASLVVRRKLKGIPKYDATQSDKIKKDELGYPELMDPNEFYTYLLRNLSNSTKSSSILKKMELLARIKPEINFLLSELSNDETFSAAFYSNMKKASVNYISVVEGKNGTVTLSANKSNLENVIIAGWESNSFNKLFNTNGEVTERGVGIATEVFETLDELYESFLAELRNNPAIGKDAEIIKLIVNKAVRELDKIGLDISTADLNIDSIKGSKVKLISTLIGNGESAKTLAAVLSKGNNPFYGPTRTTKALKKLSELFKGSYKYLVQPSFMNMNNEPMYSYVMFNYLFKVREQIKENKQLYIQNLRRDPFYKYSPFLKLIETMSDDQIEEFDIGVADGINVDNTKNRYSNFSPSQLLQYTINSYHNNGAKFGWFRFPTISDKPNLPIVKMPKLNQADVIKGLHDVYKSESARMASGVIGNEQYDNKKGLFILLPYLNSLSKEDKKRLSNYDYFAKVTREYLETKFIEENGNLIKNDVKLPSNITEKILRDWFYNSVFYNTQLISIFAGDPAFYKNAGDIQKRMAQVWSPTLLIDDRAMYIDEEGDMHSPDSHYDVMYIDDVTYKDEHVFTNLLETFIKLGYSETKAKSLLAPYNTTEVTDGQGFITLDRFRDIKIQYGEWGHIQERMYNKLQNGEYDESSVTTIFQTMKPFMFTHVWNEDLKKYIPTQHKNSEMVLLPQLAYLKNDKGEYVNPELAKLLKFMTDNNISAAQFKSVVKVGFRESYSWNEDYAYSENKRHRISSLDYGSQQNVPEHHIDHKNLLAVQARKLIISDLPDEGWPEGVTKEDIFREVQDIISSVIEDKYEIIEKSLLKDGEVNKTVLQNLLRDEISNRNSGIYAEYSTSLDENGEFIVPLFNPMTANKNQQLISAIIRNKVTKIKAPGPTLIQASAIGLSNMLEVKYNEEGGIDYYEAILPWWTKSLFPTNPDGTVDFSKLESLDILDAIGYRVPTEDKYSIIPIRPIAFLPPSAGGSILLPYSITTQTGADFDVDKLFLMTKSVMVKDGKISAYKYIQGTDEKSTTERYHAYIKSKARQELDKDAMGDINDSVWSPLKSLRDDNYKKFIAAFKERKKEIKKNALLVAKQKGIDRKDIGSFITLAIKQEYEQIWVPKFDEVTEKQTLRAKIEESSKLAEDLGLMSYEEFSALPVASQNTEKARFNRLIDIIKSIYGNYRIIPQVGIPGGFDELKKLAANVRTLEGKNLNMDVALPSTQNEFTMRNSAGGDLIGVAANAKSNHAILQRFEMAFKSPIKFIIDGEPESKKVISANQDYLKTAEISKVIAYTLAASVDNAKEPVAEDLNLNTLTLDVVVAIERVGFDFKLANYFVAQPIIKELVRKWRNKGGTAIAYREALSELYESFDSINDSIPLLSVEELTDAIGKKALFDEFQASVLQTFEYIKENNGDPLSGLTLAMKYDGSGLGQTMAHSELIIDNFVKHFSTENPHIENADIMAYPSDTYKSMIKFYELGVVRPYNDILVKLFPYDSIPFITAKNSLKRLMGKSINPDVLNKMNNFVVSKVFNNFAFFQDLDTEYLIKSFPKEFKKAIRKKDSKLNMLDSFFIKRLNKFEEEVDTLELINSSSMLGSEKDNIKSIIDYILEEGNKEEVEQIENLIKYSYVTGGLTMSPNSVASVIPETIYETLVDEDGVTLSKFLHNNVSKLIGDSQYIFDDFVMNNPSVAKTIDLDALYVLGVYGKDNPKGFKLNISKSVMDEDGKFLDYLSVRTESGYSLFKYTGFKGIYVLADKKGMGNISELQRGRSIFNSNHTSADIEVVIKKLGNFSRIKDTVIQEGLPETFNTVKEVEEKIEDVNSGLSESESDIELEGRVKRESEENKKDCN